MCWQLCGYLKITFVTRYKTYVAQNSFSLDAIDCEIIQAWVEDTHCQKYVCGKPVVQITTLIFLSKFIKNPLHHLVCSAVLSTVLQLTITWTIYIKN